MRPNRACLAFVLTIPLFAACPEALAQQKQPSAAQKTTARNLLIDCRDKVTKKDLQGALKSCAGAHAIMGVPSTGLDLAKVQEATGLFVEARETALEVVRFDNSANNPTFTTAQQEASQIAASLEARIPTLVINVSGPPEGAEISVKVDKDVLPSAAISLPYKLNPGAHLVVATAPGFEKSEQQIEVQAGQTKSLEIKLVPAGAGASSETTRIVPYDPGSKDQTKLPDGSSRGGVPTWAWIAGGVGVAGGVLAIVSGIKFGAARDAVEQNCPNDVCNDYLHPGEVADLQADWNQWLTLTIVGAVVGAGGLGAATIGIATAPKKDTVTATFVPWFAPNGGGAALVGSF